MTALLGDTSAAHAGVTVQAGGATATTVSTAAGEFVSVVQTATASSDTNGTYVTLTVAGTNWAIDVLDVRPNLPNNVGTIQLTTVPGIPQPADGFTVDTYGGTAMTGGGAPLANTLITFSTTAGTFVSADASSLYQGFQVMTNASGNFSFQLRRPNSAAMSAVLTSNEVTGLAAGQYTQGYTAATGSDLVRRFDFNTVSSPTQAGYLGVAAQPYNAVTGFGWQTAPPAFDRGGADALLRDGHYGGSNTFLADLPSGNYRVTVTSGDTGSGHDLEDIRVGGNSVLGRQPNQHGAGGVCLAHVPRDGQRQPDGAAVQGSGRLRIPTSWSTPSRSVRTAGRAARPSSRWADRRSSRPTG